MRLTSRYGARGRGGTSLVELLVALSVLGAVGAIAVAQLSSNARALSALADRLDAQSALWHGGDAASVELRAISSTGGDLLLATDSSIWYRGLVASGVLCSTPSGTSLHLLPDSLASGLRAGAGMMSVQPGDAAYVFDEGSRLDASDDHWISAIVSSASPVVDLCAGTPYLDTVLDAGRTGYRIQLQPAAIPGTVTAGAAIRVLRPSRLALYRSAPDWYLGWTDWNSSLGAWNVIQPVAGAYRPYAAPPQPGGLQFGLRDSLGAPLVPPPAPGAAGSVSVALRSQAVVRGIGAGPALVSRTDSLHLRVGLRNRQ